MNFNWTQIASIVMFLGVLLGAFGTHALRGKMDDYALSVFKNSCPILIFPRKSGHYEELVLG